MIASTASRVSDLRIIDIADVLFEVFEWLKKLSSSGKMSLFTDQDIIGTKDLEEQKRKETSRCVVATELISFSVHDKDTSKKALATERNQFFVEPTNSAS